jgi:hypothetical protein
MTCAEVEDLLELYVIGALAPQEGRDVREHLVECVQCQALELQTRELVQVLGLGVEQVEPAPDLRARIRAAITAPAQALPMPQRAATAPRPSRWRSLLDWLGPQPIRIGAAFAVVPLLLSTWLVFQVMELRTEVQTRDMALQSSWQTSQAAADIMGRALARGGAMANVSGTERAPGAWGMLYYTPAEQEGVLVVRGLPELSEGHVYQCWLMNGEQRMNAGTFYRESDGRAMVVIKSPMPIERVDAVGVTEEPHGGSVEPRGERFMWGRISIV